MADCVRVRSSTSPSLAPVVTDRRIERDPSLVERDLAEGRIDERTARDVYHLDVVDWGPTMFRHLLLGFASLLPMATAHAEVPEVRFARQFSMGYLQFNVIEHEH